MPVTAYSSKHGKPHKNKVELAARIDAKLRSLRLHSGKAEFDPVEMMALIGAEAYDEGDKHLALVAFKEVSQYVRPKLTSTSFEASPEYDPHSDKNRVLAAFASMGVQIEGLDTTYEEAAHVVEVRGHPGHVGDVRGPGR